MESSLSEIFLKSVDATKKKHWRGFFCRLRQGLKKKKKVKGMFIVEGALS